MPTAVETTLVKVKFVGPYGPNINGEFYRLGKGVSVNDFQAGHTYSVEVSQGTKCKFINKVVGDLGGEASSPVLNADTNKAPVVNDDTPRRAKFGEALTSYEIEQNQMIRRSGLVQASVQAVASHVSKKEDIAPAAILVAEALLKWVEQKPEVK